jgi:hypothetical protein
MVPKTVCRNLIWEILGLGTWEKFHRKRNRVSPWEGKWGLVKKDKKRFVLNYSSGWQWEKLTPSFVHGGWPWGPHCLPLPWLTPAGPDHSFSGYSGVNARVNARPGVSASPKPGARRWHVFLFHSVSALVFHSKQGEKSQLFVHFPFLIAVTEFFLPERFLCSYLKGEFGTWQTSSYL